ncbi:class I SAM-dependent methyltransferase [Rhodococcus sp. NPDC003318]|uniref:class I SAM-dependent methyltransferase n=1 Tax=Rhodococcus sp. NPDC003318 TaxID=3364503 RepID=UPI0036C33A89
MGEVDNDKVERVFDRLARHYERQMTRVEKLVLGPAREWAVSHARGRVLEIAVGSGLNLALYGDDVTSVVGVDLSSEMLDLARAKVVDADRIELRQGDVQALDLPDASVDTVVSTYTYCTIPDPGRASAEAYRVLVPGGRIVLAEHGPSTNSIVRVVMRAVEPLAVLLDADHLTRDPVPYLRDAGFTVDDVQRTGRGGIVFRVLAHKPVEIAGGSADSLRAG